MRRSVGGGVFALIILLALGGVLLHGVHDGRNYLIRNFSFNPDDLAEFLGSKHESDQTLEHAFPEAGTLKVDNPHGDVIITGNSSDGQVHLSVHKQVFSSSDSDAESKANQLMPRVAINGRVLSVSIPSLNGATADMTLSVPASAVITVNANHGDVHVDAVHAPVTVTANHGDIALSDIDGAVVAHGNNSGSSISAHRIVGSVSLEGRGQDLTLSDITGGVSLAGDYYGNTHLEHVTGAVKFHSSRTDFQLVRLDGEIEISPEHISADQAVGPLVLTTRHQNINLDRISGDVSVTNRNGTVDLTSAPPLGNVTVQNRNGSVTLTLPDRANFSVSAETNDGDMENDFSLASQENDSHKTLNGTVGKGGSLVRINTSQGDIALRKATIAALSPRTPAPPAPPQSPQLSIRGEDGSSVYVGKDGVRIISGADGSSVIVGKSGLKITANADGSSVYKGKDGTQLTESADGSKVFAGRDGTRYTESADGGKVYKGSDGSKITLQADGTKIGKGPHGKDLSESEMRERLQHAQDEVRNTERARDAERREHQSSKGNDPAR